MTQMNKQDLLEVTGGAISGTYINALAKGIDSILELGRSFGGAIRRWVTGNMCGF